MSDEKDKKMENDEFDSDDDVEAHRKGGLGNTATDEPKEDDDGDDVEAHFKQGRSL